MSLVALSIGSSDRYEDFHRPLELHVESCINTSPEEPFNIYPAIEIGRVFYEFAWLFYRVGNYHRGKILTGILLQKKFGAEKFCLMNDSSIRYLHAICLHSLAEFRLAQTIFESIVYSDEGSTAATRGRKLSAMAALASIYRGEGKSDLALFILRGVVETMQILSHPEILNAQHELALALLQDGNNGETISLLRDIFKIRDSTLSHRDPNRLGSQHALAFALATGGDPKEATFLLRDVLQIQSTTFNPTHPNYLASQQALAKAFLRDGNYTEALEIIQAVIIIAEKEWGPSDWRRRDCELLLAECLANMGTVSTELQ